MATAFWHYPSTSTRPAWPKDSKTVLGYDFGYVTDLVDTKNGKIRFFIVTRFKFEFLHLNFSIWSSVFDGLSNESGLVPPR